MVLFLVIELNCICRSNDNQKARVFKLIDQTSDDDIIEIGCGIAAQNGFQMTRESQKKAFLKQYQFHQMQLCQDLAVLQQLELPTMDQIPDNDKTLLAFLLKQQNRTMTTDSPVLLDFKAPLELELILLKDIQL